MQIPIYNFLTDAGVHDCQFNWPEDCQVQAGGSGIVSETDPFSDPLKAILTVATGHIPKGSKSYITAFFEAFPHDPSTFIRGEGATVAEAEQHCWNNYQKILNCTKHEFERRHYKNGYGVCKHCNLGIAKCFEPLEHCSICKIPTYFMCDIDNIYYCKDHYLQIPEDKLSAMGKLFKKQ